AGEKEIDVDGDFATGEWSNELPVFVGRKSPVNMRADIARDSENVYFSAEVNYEDASTFEEADGQDGVTFLVDAGEYNLTAPDTGLFRIFCNKDGQLQMDVGEKGKWIEENIDNVKAATRELESGEGYRVELQLPLDAIEYEEGKDLRINFKLGYQAGDKYVEENVIHADENASHTWCRASL
ncbi:MAG: exo-alpha-sialidase, partial [Bacteroidota bacterium]